MLKIIASLFLFLFITNNVYSASRILNGEFQALSSSLILLVDMNNNKKIISINLRECDKESSFDIDKSISNMAISEYISSYIIAGGDKLYLYNMQNGKIISSFDDFVRNVSVIATSDMGEFVSASDGRTVALYQFKKEGLVKLYSKEFFNGVSAIYPDIETKSLYVLERNSSISVWSFSGKLLKNIKQENPIYKLIYDEKTGKFLGISNNGLYRISKDNFAMEKVLNGKIKDIFIDDYSSRLEVMTDIGITIYDYPVMRATAIIDGVNGNIIKSDGGNFAAWTGLNFIKIYDLKENIHISTIAIDSIGNIFFYPPEMKYGGNITSSFINMAAGKKEEKEPYNKNKACALISAMINGIYTPKNINIEKVDIEEIDSVIDIPSPKVAEVGIVQAPYISFNGGNIEVRDVEDKTNVKDVKINENIKIAEEPKSPNSIANPEIKTIDDLINTKVPNWVANRKHLAKTHAVGNGQTEQESLLSARILLKNNMVKVALNNLVKSKEIEAISDIEIKKRILWQSSAKAINSMDNKIYTLDTWVSPAKSHFMHIMMDDKTLIDNSKKYLLDEIKLYFSDKDSYMKENPVRLK